MDATITVTGNVGSDIDVRTDDSNEWAYAAFRLACTPRFVRAGTFQTPFAARRAEYPGPRLRPTGDSAPPLSSHAATLSSRPGHI